MQSLIQDEGLEERIRFIDHTTDVQGILSAADLFLMPSQREGFSRSLLEEMAMELPVIATDIPAIAEALEDQRGGILVGYGDDAGLAEAVVTLCRDKALRERMGKENRARVWKYFTSEIRQAEMSSLYSTLLTR